MSVFISALSAFFFSFIAIKFIKPIAIAYGLVDKPNARKVHTGHVPLVGGISIFVAVLASSAIFLPDTLELRMFLIASAMIVFIGVLDDKYDISVRIRIIGQIIIASLMIYGVGGYISNLGDLLGFGDIRLGFFGIFFTYFSIIVAINAFNMIDGIDGLLGALSLNAFASIAILFFLSGNYQYLSYPLILATALLPYLIYNLGLFNKQSKKIFMGDAGSMFIGLSVIWLLCMGSQGESASFRPVTALWVCALPLIDMLSVVLKRIKKRTSPFKPGRDHLHHVLQGVGCCQKTTLLIMCLFSVVMSIIGIVSNYYNVSEMIMVILFVFVFITYHNIIKYTDNNAALKN